MMHAAEQLVQALQHTEEVELFRKTLVKGTRSAKLFEVMLRWPGLSKAEKFKKVFRQPYSKPKDYLIRNELSILRGKLEAFLLIREEAQNISGLNNWKSYRLAKILFEKKLFSLCEEKVDSALQRAESEEDYTLAGRLFILQNQVQQATVKELEGRIRAAQTCIRRLEENRKKMEDAYNAYQVYLAGLQQKLIYVYGDNWPDAPVQKPRKVSPRSPWSRYYTCKGQAYAAQGEKAAILLEQALQHLEQSARGYAWVQEWFSCCGQIGSEYSAIGVYDKAEIWFQKTIESPDLEKYGRKDLLIFNYLITLIKTRKYSEALNWISHLEKKSRETYVLDRLAAAKISCYVFLRDAPRLKSALPSNLSHLDVDVKLYYRMQYSIYFYLAGDLESARREILNLQRNKDTREKGYEFLARLFLKFYTWKMLPDKAQQARQMSSLHALFQKFIRESSVDNKNLVPTIWLLEEWEICSRLV